MELLVDDTRSTEQLKLRVLTRYFIVNRTGILLRGSYRVKGLLRQPYTGIQTYEGFRDRRVKWK